MRFVKPGRDFVLLGRVWPPTAVILGNDSYPSLDQVLEQVWGAGAVLHYLRCESLPLYEGTRVPANVFVLGAAVGHTGLGEMLRPSQVAQTVQTRWIKGAQRNVFAFQTGLEASVERL